MSLTSRISNLFASVPSSHLVPTSQEADGGEYDADRRHGTDSTISRKIKRMRTVEKAEADENFELKRPPYLHVCHPESILLFRVLMLIVNAWWRNWGHERRSADAFPRHCENEATRRSPFPSQVQLNVRVLPQNLPARRSTAWTVWRSNSSHAWVIPRHCYLFWDIRILQKTYA